MQYIVIVLKYGVGVSVWVLVGGGGAFLICHGNLDDFFLFASGIYITTATARIEFTVFQEVSAHTHNFVQVLEHCFEFFICFHNLTLNYTVVLSQTIVPEIKLCCS